MPRVFPPILNLNWSSRFQRAKGLAEHRLLQVSLHQRFRNQKEIGADSWCPPTIRFREFEGHADYTAISLKVVKPTRLRKAKLFAIRPLPLIGCERAPKWQIPRLPGRATWLVAGAAR